MHSMVCRIRYLNRQERAQAYVQSDRLAQNSLGRERFEKLRGEMKPRCGRRRRSKMPCENGLVINGVAHVGGAPSCNIRRQRCFTSRLYGCVQLATGNRKLDFDFTSLSAPRDLRVQVSESHHV